jgi:hypothetical protein
MLFQKKEDICLHKKEQHILTNKIQYYEKSCFPKPQRCISGNYEQ